MIILPLYSRICSHTHVHRHTHTLRSVSVCFDTSCLCEDEHTVVLMLPEQQPFRLSCLFVVCVEKKKKNHLHLLSLIISSDCTWVVLPVASEPWLGHVTACCQGTLSDLQRLCGCLCSQDIRIFLVLWLSVQRRDFWRPTNFCADHFSLIYTHTHAQFDS